MNRKSTLPSLFSSERTPASFSALQAEIDRAFDNFRSMFGSDEQLMQRETAMMPRMDVSETDKSVEIKMDLPGIKEDDLDVTLTDDILTIEGTRSEEHEEKKKSYQMMERSFGKFRRTIPLGFTVSEDKVKAGIKQGVLTVSVEKPEELAAKTRKIAIEKST